jgi:hypothetical protein
MFTSGEKSRKPILIPLESGGEKLEVLLNTGVKKQRAYVWSTPKIRAVAFDLDRP